MDELRWARLRVDTRCNLRRGAWYRVVRMESDQVFLNVNGQSEPISLDLLEVQSAAPERWTVVRAGVPAREGLIARG